MSYSILFDEQNNYVEVKYEGVNAELLASMNIRLTNLENAFNAALNGTNGQLGQLADDLDSLTTLVQAQSSAIDTEISIREIALMDLNESFALQLAAQQAAYTAAIQAEANTRAAAVLAEAAARGAAIGSATATIITDVAALATQVTALAANIGSAQSSVITVTDALATEVDARAAQYTVLQAAFNENTAAVVEESVARVNADNAMASAISVVSASFAGKVSTFRQTTAPTATAVGDIWYDSDDGDKMYRWSGSSWVPVQDAQIPINTAAITTETTARVSADSALASNISAVSAVANGAAAAVLTEQSARITADGSISGKYAVKVDVNGNVSGFDLISTANVNSTPFSTFNFRSDSFKIWNGSSAVAPFEVLGGTVYVQNLKVRSAHIEDLTVGKLTDGTLDAQIAIGAGKITWSNGVYMKVIGVGFGSTNQFIEWYGPYQTALSSCTESNAIQYLTIDGDAYFGGTLAAGVLKNGGSTTDTTASATVTFGPFLTNGDPKSIVCSYSYHREMRKDAGTGSFSGTGSATILYEKSTDGTTWTTIATVSAVETERIVIVDGDPAVKDLMRYTIGGSTTITDFTGATTTMYLRATITGRTIATFNGTGTSGDVVTQRTTVISTES